MLQLFPENPVDVKYKGIKNLKELISSSLFPNAIKEIIVQLKSVAEDVTFVKLF